MKPAGNLCIKIYKIGILAAVKRCFERTGRVWLFPIINLPCLVILFSNGMGKRWKSTGCVFRKKKLKDEFLFSFTSNFVRREFIAIQSIETSTM